MRVLSIGILTVALVLMAFTLRPPPQEAAAFASGQPQPTGRPGPSAFDAYGSPENIGLF